MLKQLRELEKEIFKGYDQKNEKDQKQVSDAHLNILGLIGFLEKDELFTFEELDKPAQEKAIEDLSMDMTFFFETKRILGRKPKRIDWIKTLKGYGKTFNKKGEN